jgi:hypothetical protein
MSSRIISGDSLDALSTPSLPSTAITTSKPFRKRRRDSMSLFISLSSTRRIFMSNLKTPETRAFYRVITTLSLLGRAPPERRTDTALLIGRPGRIQIRKPAMRLVCSDVPAVRMS